MIELKDSLGVNVVKDSMAVDTTDWDNINEGMFLAINANGMLERATANTNPKYFPVLSKDKSGKALGQVVYLRGNSYIIKTDQVVSGGMSVGDSCTVDTTTRGKLTTASGSATVVGIVLEKETVSGTDYYTILVL